MSKGLIALVAVLVGAGLLGKTQLPELRRYMKIREM
jgi:hypothetical protein